MLLINAIALFIYSLQCKAATFYLCKLIPRYNILCML